MDKRNDLFQAMKLEDFSDLFEFSAETEKVLIEERQ